MEKINRECNRILLMDDYGRDSRLLYTSFKLADIDCIPIVIDSDGFLPDDVSSVYDLLLGDYSKAAGVKGKPLTFNMIQVPDLWEISSTGNKGSVHELDRERASIYYTQPKHKRFVKIVEWNDAQGHVRLSEHYNKYGALFAKTAFNSSGKKVNKTYFSSEGKEVIHENYVTGDIIVTVEGKDRIFRDKTDLIVFILEYCGLGKCGICFNSLSYSFFVSVRLKRQTPMDILFWQEDTREDIPGNMQMILSGDINNVKHIYVQKQKACDKLIGLGASEEIVSHMGCVYDFERDNCATANALICTNSDQIEHLEKLVGALGEVHFHIAAVTEMSSKLMSMEDYANVTLYPGIKEKTFEKLLKTCDIYLDINHYDTVMDAVYRAFLNRQIIFAFENTVHERWITDTNNIYEVDSWQQMVQSIKGLLDDPDAVKEALGGQLAAASAQDRDSFAHIFDR